MAKHLILSSLDNSYSEQSEDIYLLNPLVVPFYKKEYMKSRGTRVNQFKDVYIPISEIDNTIEYVWKVYEDTIDLLSINLNNFHRTNYSRKFWQYALGVDLWFKICSFYTKYIQIKTAIDADTQFYTYAMECDKYKEKVSHYWNRQCTVSDEYNYFANSFIIRNIKHPNIEILDDNMIYSVFDDKDFINNVLLYSEKKPITVKSKIYEYLIGCDKNTKIICDRLSIGQSNVLFKWMTLISHRKIGFMKYDFWYRIYEKLIEQECNANRSFLHEGIADHDEFERILGLFLEYMISPIFVERFNDAVDLVGLLTENFEPRVISSSGNYIEEPLFTLWSAFMMEKGVKIISLQHGAGFPICKFSEFFERKVFDGAVIWGNEMCSEKGIIPGMAFKCLGGKQRCKSFKGLATPRKIIFMGYANYGPGRGFFFDGEETDAENKRKEAIKLYKLLNDDRKYDLTIRELPSRALDGKEIVESALYHKEELSNSKIQTINGCSFYDSVMDNDLCIVELLETPFLEIINWNKPVIILAPQKGYYYTDSIREIVKKFKSMGILFEKADECKRYIDSINSIDKWWNEDERQALIKEFKNKCCYNPGFMWPFKALSLFRKIANDG